METGNNVTPLFENQPEELLTYQECADRLKIPLSTLQKMVHRREMPFLKVGKFQVRFLWSQVMEALTKGGSNGSQDRQR